MGRGDVKFGLPVNDWARAPTHIVSAGRGFERCSDCYGTGTPLQIVWGDPASGPTGLLVAYRETPDAEPMLATGRMIVRFSKGIPPDLQSGLLAEVGFCIQSISSHAPQTAVLKPLEPGVGESLSRLEALRQIPGAEQVSVEWQAV